MSAYGGSLKQTVSATDLRSHQGAPNCTGVPFSASRSTHTTRIQRLGDLPVAGKARSLDIPDDWQNILSMLGGLPV